MIVSENEQCAVFSIIHYKQIVNRLVSNCTKNENVNFKFNFFLRHSVWLSLIVVIEIKTNYNVKKYPLLRTDFTVRFLFTKENEF
jgi:hypothetical protein